MQDSSLEIYVFEDANAYILALGDTDRAKILAHINLMSEGDYAVLRTKQLSGPVRELIVKQHRIVYFEKQGSLYFVDGFRKKSAKTPKYIIDHAKQLHRMTV